MAALGVHHQHTAGMDLLAGRLGTGRQPWTIQDLLPVQAAVSAIPSGNVVLTFCLFALLFTMLLAAEISIMLRYISRKSKTNIME